MVDYQMDSDGLRYFQCWKPSANPVNDHMLMLDVGIGVFTPDRAAALMPSMLPRLKSSETNKFTKSRRLMVKNITLWQSIHVKSRDISRIFLGEFLPQKNDPQRWFVYFTLLHLLHIIYILLYEYRLECILTDLNVSSLTLQPREDPFGHGYRFFAVQPAPQQLDIIDSRKPPTCSRMKKLFWHAPCNSWRSMAINGCLGLGQDRRHPWNIPQFWMVCSCISW